MAQASPAEMADLSDDDIIAVLPDCSRSIPADTTDTDIVRYGNERELQDKWRQIMVAFNDKSEGQHCWSITEVVEEATYASTSSSHEGHQTFRGICVAHPSTYPCNSSLCDLRIWYQYEFAS
jgi:hypothetical protein